MFSRTNLKQDNLDSFIKSFICCLFLISLSIISASAIQGDLAETLIEINNINQTSAVLIHKVKVVDKPGVIMMVTAYNAGDVYQTDNDPCKSATGDDVCALLEQGINVCAINSLPFYSIIKVEKMGECLVLDRTNSKYKNRVDWAMKLSEKERAIKFGKQKLEIQVIYNPNDQKYGENI